jgi:hypothetical protein
MFMRATELLSKITGARNQVWTDYVNEGNTFLIIKEISETLALLDRAIADEKLDIRNFIFRYTEVYNNLIDAGLSSAAAQFKKEVVGKPISYWDAVLNKIIVPILLVSDKKLDRNTAGKLIDEISVYLSLARPKMDDTEFNLLLEKVQSSLKDPNLDILLNMFVLKYGYKSCHTNNEILTAIDEFIKEYNLEYVRFEQSSDLSKIYFLPPVTDVWKHISMMTGYHPEHGYSTVYCSADVRLLFTGSKDFSYSSTVLKQELRFYYDKPLAGQMGSLKLFLDRSVEAFKKPLSLIDIYNQLKASLPINSLDQGRFIFLSGYLQKNEFLQMADDYLHEVKNIRWSPMESSSDNYYTYNRENNEFDEMHARTLMEKVGLIEQLKELWGASEAKRQAFYWEMVRKAVVDFGLQQWWEKQISITTAHL